MSQPEQSQTRREAVEAAAFAIEEAVNDRDAVQTHMAYGEPVTTVDHDAIAVAAYDAIEPPVRRAVAEEIADSLREHYDADEDRVRFGDWESCSDQCPGVLMDYVLKLVEDVAIVRQVGMHEREEASAQ